MLFKMIQMNALLVPSHYLPCIGKYELDLMQGCTVNCAYCSLKTEKYERLDIERILDDRLPEDITERGIYLSPNSDPFAKPVQENAHHVLEALLPRNIPFLIITKNHIPQKTIDLMAIYPKQIYVQISIGRIDDAINRYLEPGSASAADRLDNIKKLCEAGINTTALLMPLFPEVDDIPKILQATIMECANAGARYAKAAYAVIPSGDTRAIEIMQSHPLLRKSLGSLTEYLKIHIGGGMTAPEYRRKELYARLKELCSVYGMKFYTCPILDPAVLSNPEAVCRTFTRKNSLYVR